MSIIQEIINNLCPSLSLKADGENVLSHLEMNDTVVVAYFDGRVY